MRLSPGSFFFCLFFTSSIFPRSPCRKSPSHRSHQVFLVLPDEVSLNASSPSLRLWGWGKPSPTQNGSPEIFFFWTNFFTNEKKPKRMVIFAIFLGNACGNKFTFFWARFSFCLAQVTFLVRWIRWGVKIIDENRHNLLKLFIARSWIKLSAIASTSKLELCCLWPSRRPEQGAFGGCRRAPVLLWKLEIWWMNLWDEMSSSSSWPIGSSEQGFLQKHWVSAPNLDELPSAIAICPCDCHNVGWIF